MCPVLTEWRFVLHSVDFMNGEYAYNNFISFRILIVSHIRSISFQGCQYLRNGTGQQKKNLENNRKQITNIGGKPSAEMDCIRFNPVRDIFHNSSFIELFILDVNPLKKIDFHESHSFCIRCILWPMLFSLFIKWNTKWIRRKEKQLIQNNWAIAVVC